jgi:hypothetical protein
MCYRHRSTRKIKQTYSPDRYHTPVLRVARRGTNVYITKDCDGLVQNV